jgi:hypothetical protein
MKKKELFERYKKILKKVDKKIDNVNRGGCGIFAFELGKQLKRQGIEFEYVMLFTTLCKEDKSYVKDLMRNNMVRDFNFDTNWTHIVIKVGKKYIDGEGIRSSLTDVGLPMSEEFLTNLIDAEQYWNDTFDRKQRKKIEKILEKNLAD